MGMREIGYLIFKKFFQDKWKLKDGDFLYSDPVLYRNQLDAFNYGFSYQREELEKLQRENEILLRSMKEIANGHLEEKVSEMIARKTLEECENIK